MARVWFQCDEKGYFKGRMTKRGIPPPKTLTQGGTLLVADGEIFDVHVVVRINPTGLQ